MKDRMFHVFRNSPMGRENLMQAVYFCHKQFGVSLSVYIPTTKRFVVPFESEEIMVELDNSYLQYPETAKGRVETLFEDGNVALSLFEPMELADKNLPEIPTDWAIMSCPRVISEKSNRIGLGHIGPKVRGIVKHAPFPVFIPAMAYKEWNGVTIFFGGSKMGAIAVKQGIARARLAQVPFTIFTQLDGVTREDCEAVLDAEGMSSYLNGSDASWRFFDSGTFEENLYDVPHDHLVVVGAAGHRLITELLFGSKLEIIQATLVNPLLVVGPHCRVPAEMLI